MDIQRIVYRLMGDASHYTRTMEQARDTMNRIGSEMGRSDAFTASSGRIEQNLIRFDAQLKSLKAKQLVDGQNHLAKQLASEAEYHRRREIAGMEHVVRMRVSSAPPAAQAELHRRFEQRWNEGKVRLDRTNSDSWERLQRTQQNERNGLNQRMRQSNALLLTNNPPPPGEPGNRFTRFIGRAARGVSEFSEGLSNQARKAGEDFAFLGNSVGHASRALGWFSVIAGVGVVAGTVAAAKSALSLAADYEQATIAFEVMTKSADTGAKLLKDIQTLAVESPFQTAQLAQNAKEVLAFGFEVDNVIPILSRLGDISSGTGADMSRLILALGQVRTTGRLMGQELRQFTNAGVPILEYLAKVLNTTSQAVPNMVRQGKISYSDVAAAINLMTNEGGLFYGMMGRINKETTIGRWENFKENVQLTGIAFGQAFFDIFRVKELLTESGNWIKNMNMEGVKEGLAGVRLAFYSLWQGIKSSYSAIVEWVSRNQSLVAGTIATIIVVKALVVGLGALAFLITPVGMLTAAVGGLIAAFVALGMFDNLGDRLAQGFENLFPVFRTAWRGIVDAVKSNDLELAMKILMEAITIGWKHTIALMEVEWERFTMKLKGKQTDAQTSLARGIINWMPSFDQTPERKRQMLRVLNEDYAELKKVNERASDNRTKQITQDAMNQLAAATKRIEADALSAHVGADAKEYLTSDTAQNIERFLRVDLKDKAAPLWGPGGTHPLSGAAVTPGGFNPQFPRPSSYDESTKTTTLPEVPAVKTMADFMPVYPSGSVVPPGGGVNSVMGGAFVESTYRKLWTDAATKIQTFQQKSKLGLSAEEMKPFATAVNEAVKQLDLFQDAIKGTTKAAEVARELVISPQALSAAREIGKEYDKGTTAVDRFTTQIRLLAEAAEGNEASRAVMGNAAFALHPDPVLARKIQEFGNFRAFENLQRETENNRDKFAPAAIAGSREAQEIIMRSDQQSLTVEQQVLQTLRDGIILQQKSVIYQKEVSDALKKYPVEAKAAGLPVG